VVGRWGNYERKIHIDTFIKTLLLAFIHRHDAAVWLMGEWVLILWL
jgi:hypothetical protein